MSRTYRPPETGLSRLEIRDPITQGRLAWGYISDDESLIMSDAGEVWVRHGPREVFGSEKAAEPDNELIITSKDKETGIFTVSLKM